MENWFQCFRLEPERKTPFRPLALLPPLLFALSHGSLNSIIWAIIIIITIFVIKEKNMQGMKKIKNQVLN